jgi:signal transduction histidine kinase
LFVVQRNLPVDPVQVVLRLVGASFTACGLIAWRRRPDNRSGLLMALAGFAVFLSPVLGLLENPIARTLALWLSDLWLLFFVPLVLTLLAGGRLRTRADGVIACAVLALIAVLTPLHLMFTPNPLEASLFLVIPVATAAVIAVRWRRASVPGRRALLPGVAGALCLLVFAALLVQVLATGETSRPLLWLGASSLVTVPLAFLAGLLRSRLARGSLADLFRGLSTMCPAQLRPALAEALGDPGFRIAYPGPDGYVDGDGRPVTVPSGDADRSVTHVEQDGERVAALIYDPVLDDDPELVDVVAGAASVALENRRLHAEADARLGEVQASRQRIIAAADAERRRIERNLHDGAQQRLVTLALQLSLIRRRTDRTPRTPRSSSRPQARSSPHRCRSSVSSPAEYTRRRWTTAWRTRWRHWPCGRRCPSRCRAGSWSRCRSRSRSRPTSSPPKRWPTPRSTRARRRRRCAWCPSTATPSSRSPTTGSVAPTQATAQACAAWGTGSTRSTAPCGSPARRTAARSSPRRSPTIPRDVKPGCGDCVVLVVAALTRVTTSEPPGWSPSADLREADLSGR